MKQLLVVLGLLVWLAGCSGEPFHLRGSKSTSALVQQAISLQGIDRNSDFGLALQDGLEDAGAVLHWDGWNNKGALLTIANFTENRSVSGYSSTRQVREFIHTVDVTFRVRSAGMDESAGQSVHAERSQVYDGQYVLGTVAEEDDIKAELRDEAVRLIILRLQAIMRKS